jgi:hypothetical protein
VTSATGDELARSYVDRAIRASRAPGKDVRRVHVHLVLARRERQRGAAQPATGVSTPSTTIFGLAAPKKGVKTAEYCMVIAMPSRCAGYG